jgi:hypothetical protein
VPSKRGSGRQGFGGEHVERGAAQATLNQRRSEVCLDDHIAAGDVDQNRVTPHAREFDCPPQARAW